MDFKDKIVETLVQALQPEFVRLEDDDGVSGFVVSRAFEGMTTLDRQAKIEEILKPEDRRRILMIAGLTPQEYDAVGARIRVHKVKEMAGGAVEILLHGGKSDAEYVQASLRGHDGIETSPPKPVKGAIGVLMSFRAKGSGSHPLTKEKAIRFLKKDHYIEVMSNA